MPVGMPGPPGRPQLWRSGSGAPANTLGNEGDFYLDYSADVVYQKVSGVYSSTGTIKGASGVAGTSGSAGLTQSPIKDAIQRLACFPWTSRTIPQGNNWASLACSDELGVVVSVSQGTGTNRAMYSPDGGTSWFVVTSTVMLGSTWNSVCWSKEKRIFVAVGASVVATSPDGKTWTARTPAASLSWRAVAWSSGIGLFAAVADDVVTGDVMTSPDGITWTLRNGAATNNWLNIGASSSMFVAVSYSGVGNRVMTSTDGITWTSRTSASDNVWRRVEYSPQLGLWVAVSTDPACMTSPDGVTWTSRAGMSTGYSLAWCNDLGIFLSTFQGAQYSYDGKTWISPVYTGVSGKRWVGLAYSSLYGRFIVSSDAGEGVWTSYNLAPFSVANTDPIDRFKQPKPNTQKATYLNTWGFTQVATADDTATWESVCWAPEISTFVAISDGGANRAMTSSDGRTWTIHSCPSETWASVCWSPALRIFVAVGILNSTYVVMSSPDGITWTGRSATTNQWKSVCWSPELGLFCAVGQSGTGNRAMTSPDGVTWTTQTTPEDNSWVSVCWSPQLRLFVAVAAGGTNRVMISPDGYNWSVRMGAATNQNWNAVTWSPELGLFCAVSAAAANGAMTSPDGLVWTNRTLPAALNYNSLVWAAELGIFVAIIGQGTALFLTSADGINWTTRSSIASNPNWSSITWSPQLGVLVAVAAGVTGKRGLVSRSTADFSPVTNPGLVYSQTLL